MKAEQIEAALTAAFKKVETESEPWEVIAIIVPIIASVIADWGRIADALERLASPPAGDAV